MDIQEAFAEYKHLGVGTQDWPAWAALFTEDAQYWERGYNYYFDKGGDIGEWIIPEMKQHAFLSLWMEWAITDGDKVCLYIWNNLPTPAGVTGRHFGFPNSTFLQLDTEAAAAGETGKWSAEWDHYSSLDGAETFSRWMRVGGHPKGAVANWDLTGVKGWQPQLSPASFSRDEVESAVEAWSAAAQASWNGDAAAWLDTFTDDALLRDHGIGATKGLRTPHEFWSETGKRAGTEDVDHVDIAMPWSVIEGNRIGVFFTVAGASGTTDGCTILQYAGNGKFNFQEDVYNPMGLKDILSGS